MSRVAGTSRFADAPRFVDEPAYARHPNQKSSWAASEKRNDYWKDDKPSRSYYHQVKDEMSQWAPFDKTTGSNWNRGFGNELPRDWQEYSPPPQMQSTPPPYEAKEQWKEYSPPPSPPQEWQPPASHNFRPDHLALPKAALPPRDARYWGKERAVRHFSPSSNPTPGYVCSQEQWRAKSFGESVKTSSYNNWSPEGSVAPKEGSVVSGESGSALSKMSADSTSENDTMLSVSEGSVKGSRSPKGMGGEIICKWAPKKLNLHQVRMASQVIKLNNGREMPIVSFGTGSQWIGKDVTQAVRWALEAGYHHFDCGELYENVAYLGQTFAEYLRENPDKKREDYFFTVKLSHCINDKKHPLIGVKKMLSILGINYVDLLLIHSPYEKNGQGRRRRDLNDIWARMEDLVEVGLVKSIGVSNFRISDLELLMKGGKIRPVVNQVETHASLMQMGLRKFMARYNIATASYGNTVPARYQPDPRLIELLDKLSEKYNKSHSQLLIRFNIERGIQVVTTSCKEKHIVENSEVLDFEIADDDMEQLVSVARHAAPKEKYWKVKCGFHINTNVW